MIRNLVLLVTLLGLSACGGAEIGETCDRAGEQGACVDGAVCTVSAATAICRKACTDDSDCEAGESCLPVSSGLKSCQPE